MNNLVQARRYLVELLNSDPSNEEARKLLVQLDNLAKRYVAHMIDMVENELA